MKSKFAKFVDSTLGACLIFLAATAVFRYFTTLELAVFSGVTVAACAVLLLHVTGLKRQAGHELSQAADAMFYEFMFLPDASPAKKFHSALVAIRPEAKLHGKAVYLGKTAAFFIFDDVTQRALARAVNAARHFGAKRAVIFTKTPPPDKLAIDGFDIEYASVNAVYKLFRSIGALPAPNYSARNGKKRSVFVGALDHDKAVKYLLLAVCLFFTSMLSGYSIIPLVCSIISAALCAASIVATAVKRIKRAAPDSPNA